MKVLELRDNDIAGLMCSTGVGNLHLAGLIQPTPQANYPARSTFFYIIVYFSNIDSKDMDHRKRDINGKCSSQFLNSEYFYPNFVL